MPLQRTSLQARTSYHVERRAGGTRQAMWSSRQRAIFTSLFPPDVLQRVVAATSARLVANGSTTTSEKELLAVIAGVSMMSALYHGMSRKELFSSAETRSAFLPCPNLSDFISLSRVDDVLSSLMLSDGHGTAALPRPSLPRSRDAALIQRAHGERVSAWLGHRPAWTRAWWRTSTIVRQLVFCGAQAPPSRLWVSHTR
jgi:hypothetical protein